jgi:hypothetical protein
MFKKGDIVNYGNIISYGDIVSYDGNCVVKLLSDPVWDYYYTLGGWKSKEKSWHCEALHLSGMYVGQRVNVFHVGECKLVLPFSMERKIKKHVL